MYFSQAQADDLLQQVRALTSPGSVLVGNCLAGECVNAWGDYYAVWARYACAPERHPAAAAPRPCPVSTSDPPPLLEMPLPVGGMGWGLLLRLLYTIGPDATTESVNTGPTLQTHNKCKHNRGPEKASA